MDEVRLAARMRAVAAAESTGFANLVTVAGLNPKRDFRHADLSGVDLRGEDLRSFDFTGASLKGAQILGAQLPTGLTKAQLSETARTVRALTILVGEPLLQEASRITDALSPQLDIPHTLNAAIRQLDADRIARQRRSGAFIGDSGDVARRRLSRPFRDYLQTLPARAPALVLFEPEGDFDFDTLKVIRASLERSGRSPFVFAFPQVMESDDAGQTLARARLREIPNGVVMNMSKSSAGLRMGYYVGGNNALSQLKRSREKAFAFLTALSWSRLLTSPPASKATDPAFDRAGDMVLRDGLRMGRETLEAAIDRVLDAQPYDSGTERRFLLLRSDAFDRSDLTALAARSRRHERWDLSSFPVRAGHEAQFFVVSGPARSPLWNAMRDIGSEG